MGFLPHTPKSKRTHHLILAGIVLASVGVLLVSIYSSPWFVIGAMIAAGAVYVSYKEPMWTVLFLMAWWPIEPFVLKFVSDDLYLYARYFSESLIYVLALVVIVGLFTERYKRRATAVDLPLVLFLVILIASVILNTLPVTDAVLGMRQIMRFMLLFPIVLYRYPRRFWIKRAMIVVVATLLIQSLLGITQAVAGGTLDQFLLPSERRTYGEIQLTEGTVQFWDPGQRVFGTFGRYDRMGTFLAFALLMLIGLVYEGYRKQDWRWLGIIAALGVPAILLTYSRSAWFGLVFGGLAIAWLRKDKKVLIASLIVGVVLAGTLGFAGIQRTLTDVPRQTVVERFFEVFSYERFRGEYLGLGRTFWIVHTPTTVVSHNVRSLLFGWGPSQYGAGAVSALHNTRAYDETGLPFGVYGTEGYIDNNWFSLWGETGTLGVIFYAWVYFGLMLIAWKVARHSRTSMARGVAAGFFGMAVALWINAFLATFLEIRTLAPYFWIFGAFVVVLGSREKVLETRIR